MIWEVDETLDSHVEWDEFLLAYRYSNIALNASIIMFSSLFSIFFHIHLSHVVCVCVCVLQACAVR